MHPALVKLFWLRVHGHLRSGLRTVKTVRGALLSVFSLLILGMMLGPSIAVRMTGDWTAIGQTGGPVSNLLPLGLLAYCLINVVTSMGERAIYFAPSEIDFLFPAPISRRQLLLFKILGNSLGALALAAFLATVWIGFGSSWLSAAVGLFLALLFVNALVMCSQLLSQTVSEQANTRIRKGVLLVVVALISWGLAQTLARGIDSSWLEINDHFRQSLAGRVLLAPFEVYGKVMTARTVYPELAAWGLLGLVMALMLYALAVALDANYLETSVRVSQRIQERLKRARRGAHFGGLLGGRITPRRLPPLPWLGGTGPIAHRQLLLAWRSSRGYLLLMLVILAAMSFPLFMALRDSQRAAALAPAAVIGGMAYLSFLISAQMPLAFRGDVEHMDWLKALPLSPLAIAAGQLSVVTILLTLLQSIVFALTTWLYPGNAVLMVCAAAAALPINLLIFGIENIMILLFPTSQPTSGAAGLLMIARISLVMMIKALVLMAFLTAAAIPAVLIYLATGNMLAGFVVGWILLMALAMLGVLATAWAFRTS